MPARRRGPSSSSCAVTTSWPRASLRASSSIRSCSSSTTNTASRWSGKDGIAALAFWAAGFTNALNAFPALEALAETDDALAATMMGILRHLPIDPDAAADIREEFAREQQEIAREVPLADLDDALDELVACVLEIAEIARPNRPATRATPKVGRNDPCPCGSGRKYKGLPRAEQ